MEKTCGNCPNLYIGGIIPRMPIAACKITDFIVPHEWNGEKFTFWRVPLDCMRQDGGVKKSTKQAPRKEWIIKTISEVNKDDQS